VNNINQLAATLGLTIEEFYGVEGDCHPTQISAVKADGVVALYARDAEGLLEGLLSLSDDEPTGCIECGDVGNHVRDDWELLDGKRLCCHCASERLSDGGVPQDWQFDGE
jgi:hypothetical protein